MADFFETAKITGTSLGDQKRVLLAQLRILGEESDDDSAEPADDCEAISPLGLVARPAISSETEAVIARDGSDVVALAIVDKSLARLDSDPSLEEGETRLYGAQEPAAIVRIKANGDIVILPKSGQKIYLGDPDSTQPAPLGTDLNTYLEELRDAINQLRSDMSSAIAGHTHSIDLGSCTAGGLTGPQSTAASTGLAAIPGGSDAGDPPSLSDVVRSA